MEQTESSSFRMSEGFGLWERTKGHCGLTATRARLGRGMAEIIATRTPARPRGVGWGHKGEAGKHNTAIDQLAESTQIPTELYGCEATASAKDTGTAAKAGATGW
jgi:hypothetical protein